MVGGPGGRVDDAALPGRVGDLPLDLRTAVAPALVAGLGGLVALTLVGVATSHAAARRADLQQLREAG